MTPLPPALGGPADLVAWRLDSLRFAESWDSGEGAFQAGGRWNSRGVRAVYCALDPATAILEVAVHKGFRVLDTVPHVLTALTLDEPGAGARAAPRGGAQPATGCIPASPPPGSRPSAMRCWPGMAAPWSRASSPPIAGTWSSSPPPAAMRCGPGTLRARPTAASAGLSAAWPLPLQARPPPAITGPGRTPPSTATTTIRRSGMHRIVTAALAALVTLATPAIAQTRWVMATAYPEAEFPHPDHPRLPRRRRGRRRRASSRCSSMPMPR